MKTFLRGIGFGLGFYVGKLAFDVGTVIMARKLLAKELAKTSKSDE